MYLSNRMLRAATLILAFQTYSNSSIVHVFAQEEQGGDDDQQQLETTTEQEVDQQEQINPSPSKPNIVLILADDVGTGDIPFYWPGMEDQSKVAMPHLQALANKGVLFKDAHSTPLCAPSRYMVLSGNYPHRGSSMGGTWNLATDENQFGPYQKSIAEVLANNGYGTGMFGKWHLGGKIPPNGIKTKDRKMETIIKHPEHNWNLPLIEGPGDIGFQKSYIAISGIQGPPYSFFENDLLVHTVEEARWWPSGVFEMPEGSSIIKNKRGGQGAPDWDSSAFDLIVVNKTKEFIEDHIVKRPNDPFFAYVALGAVHVPHSPPNFYLDGSTVKGSHQTLHLDMLSVMDKAVGSVVSTIEENNLAENTIIIFTSDNGGLKKASTKYGHSGHGPLRGAKGMVWEGGHRVPLIIRQDGTLPQGKKRGKLVGLNDLYATICEMVGVTVPWGSAQDSVSFAKYTRRAKLKQGMRKFLGTWKVNESPWQIAVRKGKLKLIHFPHNNTFQMYNLKNDISETKNVIDTSLWVQKQFNIMYDKLKQIGPCPGTQDSPGRFYVQVGYGVYQQHDCNWYRANIQRCEQYSDPGEWKCPATCGRYQEMCTNAGAY